MHTPNPPHSEGEGESTGSSQQHKRGAEPPRALPALSQPVSTGVQSSVCTVSLLHVKNKQKILKNGKLRKRQRACSLSTCGSASESHSSSGVTLLPGRREALEAVSAGLCLRDETAITSQQQGLSRASRLLTHLRARRVASNSTGTETPELRTLLALTPRAASLAGCFPGPSTTPFIKH